MFIPAPGKVVVEPHENKNIIERGDIKIYRESGKVLAVGEGVTFVKNGDILFFEDYGCVQTQVDPDGKTYWIVWMDEKIVLGKYIL